MALQFDARQTLFQGQGGSSHLLQRQAHPLGAAGTARGEGDFSCAFRHPWYRCKTWHPAQPDALAQGLAYL